MQILLGAIFHFIGGFASGSFYMPFKKVRGWAWESYWIIGGLFSWLIVPPLAAWLTLSGFSEIIRNASVSSIQYTVLFGVLWGIGGLTYGLGVRYLGMSLGNSVVLGFCSAFGAIVPSIYYAIVPTEGKTSIVEMMTNTWGQVVLLGVAICLLGIYISGRAGVMKERELPDEEKKKSVAEFSLVKGLIVAIASGILSSCFVCQHGASRLSRGIKVYMLGNRKGVAEKQLGVGAYFLGFNQRIYTFPVFQQNYIWDGNSSINFQSREGLDVSGDFGISYSLVADSVPVIFQKYRRGIDEITNIFLRNMVRDVLNNVSSRMSIESIYGVNKRELLFKVDSMVSKQTKRYGIIIERIYTIGELHLPPTIETAINAKLEANQKAQQGQNEVKAVEAEATKKIVRTKADAESQVIVARAQADSRIFVAKAQGESIKIKAEAQSIKVLAQAQADSIKMLGESQAYVNQKLARSLNKDLIQYRSIDRWDGKLPQISGQNLPFVSLSLPKQ